MVAVYGYVAILIVPVWFLLEGGYQLIRGRVAARRIIALLSADARRRRRAPAAGARRRHGPADLHDPATGADRARGPAARRSPPTTRPRRSRWPTGSAGTSPAT